MKKVVMFIVLLLILSGCKEKRNKLVGTWNLESQNKIITLSNGEELILNPSFVIEEDNLSEENSCGGSGCKYFVYSNKDENVELYVNNLCFLLVDDDTLKQIKCHSNNIIGYDGFEDTLVHDIIYKREK